MATQSTTTTMQAHDDLAALLARNLTLSSVPISMPAPDLSQAPAEQPKIVYSISQHYHHSAHAVKPEPVAQPEPEQQQQHQQQQTPEQLLAQNGVDPTALTPVQLALFKMSAPDRRDYLLQLWRICPPTRTAADYNPVAAGAAWDTMEAEMEKEIASSQMRAQQNQQNLQMAGEEQAMSLDGTPVSVAHQQAAGAPTTQSADGRWLQTSTQGYMEPYMATGYEELARREYMASNSPTGFTAGGGEGSDASVPRSKFSDATPDSSNLTGVRLRYQATDPVYANRLASSSRASWPQPHLATTEMENQYGALMAMRDGCEMEM